MKIALAQINSIIGNFEYNVEKILDCVNKATENKAELVIFHELVLCGYPPKDLLLKKQFIDDCNFHLKILSEKIKIINPDIYVIVGFPEKNNSEGKPLFNSLAIIKNGEVLSTRSKTLIPTYDVFDEDRYFEVAKAVEPIKIKNKTIGLTVCEDIWIENSEWTKPRYHINPLNELLQKGVEIIINCSSSPYFIGKVNLRENVLKKSAKKYKTPVVYVNQVGANDELIFDGNSCVINSSGEIVLRLNSFEEDLQYFDLNNINLSKSIDHNIALEEEIICALKTGIKDYINKCGFKKVVLGLSGGIDSALVATLATFALGKENVIGVFMPSRYTSNESKIDAELLAQNLDIELKTFPIETSFNEFLNLLNPIWKDSDGTLTQENIQARIRGLILMAISNQYNALVLSTGNKSEVAVGYCTLYGDMCGGLAAISDIPKTLVYKLSRYINKKYNFLIPENSISRAPSAELRPNQKDQDTLPEYEILDQIINLYVENHVPIKELMKKGFDKETVKKICNMIDKNEYKRQQSAPTLKLTSRSFGYEWRMPVAKQYKENF